jgi:uncharacterized protein with PIN domain
MTRKQATFRFYAELTDFLARDINAGTMTVGFDVPGNVKDMIESCGVPHTEVDLILINGQSVDFAHRVTDGDRISVYPLFESVDVTPLLMVRPPPPPRIRFVADNHLSRLARFLRLLGIDTTYGPDWTDGELVRISRTEERILLTRDVGLLKHGSLTHGYFVRATEPYEQVTEVGRRFQLARHLEPFTRCMNCNGALRPVEKEEVAHRIPPQTRSRVEDFRRCMSCDQIYWEGSHHRSLTRIIESVRTSAQS